ncbi:hypothetical protein HAU38_10150 [Weissella confusa]|uniref:hypothetical protein n=1 Tax=Weissella confusa TaxID=1583 RepID=UPI0018F19464|nr:hypothetical protein [Weissella confusa]MBJ7676465.1 hypothetical protein [Weissella confusa]
MLAVTIDFFVVVIYWWGYIWLKQRESGINFLKRGYEVLTGVLKKIPDDEVIKGDLKKIIEAYLKNEKLRRTISLIVNIVMKLNLASLLNAVIYGVVLWLSGNTKDTPWAMIMLGSLISIAIDYVLYLGFEPDLDKERHALSKNFIDALMQLSVVITLIAGLINLKLTKNNESILVFILYVFPALISYKYQLKVFDKDNENKED